MCRTVRYSSCHMANLIAVVLLIVQLGGAFGAASAEATAISSGEMEVSLSVEVAGNPASVVAHLIDPGDDQTTTTLILSGESFVGTVIVERADLLVVFEAIGAGGNSEQSGAVSLTALGVAVDVLLDDPGTVDQPDPALTLDAATERWGWAALAFGAGALSLLAWWALADYPRRRRSVPEEPADQD